MKKLTVHKGTKSLDTISPLQRYLQEIGKYPLLEPEEEYELAAKHFSEGDRQAAHRLITSNLRLVVKIANDFRKAQVSMLDLIQEGNYGLMQAVKKFNPYKGIKLSSYSVWWIRAYILKYLMDNRSQVKIATTAVQRKLYYNLRKETERLLQEYEEVTPKLLAEKLDVTEKDILEMQKRLISSDISIDTPISEDGSTTILGTLIDDKVEDIETYLVNEQLNSVFKDNLEEFKINLKERDLEIFNSRIIAESPLTLQEIGAKYGISRERARQIEARIIKNLKEFIIEKGTLDIK